MLLRREDLRRRLIRLIGKGRISAATHAMDDAGARVFRYLFMQLVVNVSYGIPVAIGLYFIGVPNAVLWGAFATVLRFIPYIGPWIAAAIPVALSLAVSPSWTMPLLTIGLFVLLELLSNNVMEPWLYGSSTGVTPIALIIAAVFWTWLWGPVGLILSTPLTVCLVVMGRHVPRLSFLSVLLSDEEALTPAEDCYHRLLTVGEQDELEFVESYLKANSLTALYDSVFIPVIIATETDHRLELLDDEQRSLVEQSLRDIIEDLGTRSAGRIEDRRDGAAAEETPSRSRARAVSRFLFARAGGSRRTRGRDARAVAATARLRGAECPGKARRRRVARSCGKGGCGCGLHLGSFTFDRHPRALSLRETAGAFPSTENRYRTLGHATQGVTDAARRLRDSGADEVVTTLADAVVQLGKTCADARRANDTCAYPCGCREARLRLAISRMMWTLARRKTIHPKRRSAPADRLLGLGFGSGLRPTTLRSREHLSQTRSCYERFLT